MIKIGSLIKYWWIILFSVLIMFVPFVLTRNGWECFDFSNTGQIGDTIGGITAPFVGILGSFLVYLGFKEQIKSNKIQLFSLKTSVNEQHEINNRIQKELVEQKNIERIDKILNIISKDIDNFSFTSNNPIDNFILGKTSINEFVSRLYDFNNLDITDLVSFKCLLETLRDTIINVDRNCLHELYFPIIKYQYLSKISKPFEKNNSKLLFSNKKPDEKFELVLEIINLNESINILLKNIALE